jgi:outer membrane protein assembly factor BamB
MSIFAGSLKAGSSGKLPGRGNCSSQLCRRVTLYFIVLLLLPFLTCKKDNISKDEPDPIAWQTQLTAEVYFSSPALSSDEKTVYTGTSTGFLGNHLLGQEFVALDASTGSEKWKLQLGRNEVRSTPAIGPDKSIYFTVELRDPISGLVTGDELWHVSSNGLILWRYNINPSGLTIEIGQSSPAIGSDGTIYVAGDKLYAIYPNGTFRWSALSSSLGSPEALRNSPVIGNDGTVYFVYHNIPLTALDPTNGSVKWSCTLGVNDHCFASPAIGKDGKIYVATQPGLVYAVSAEGQPLWTFDLASAGFTGTLRSSPAIDGDGCVYFGINTGNPSSAFFALNPDGTLKWIFEPADLPDDVPDTHFDIYSSPALGTDSLVYFGQEFGRVYGLRRTDGSMSMLVNTSSGITWSSPAIDKKGMLYISDLT